METIIESKFDFGRVVATTTLANYCEKKGFSMLPYLIRHANGDWGDVCKEDWKSNDEALKNGLRLLSEYKLPDGRRIWIITEWDRSATTLPLSQSTLEVRGYWKVSQNFALYPDYHSNKYCDLTESAKKKSFKCKGLPRIKKVMRKPFLF